MVKSSLKLGLILLVICAVSTGLLAYVNSITAPVINENNIKAQIEARKEVLPKASDFNDLGDGVFKGVDESGNLAGYTVNVKTAGYGGDIDMIVGINSDNTVSGVAILSMSETPGLGAKANDEGFLSQYIAKNKTLELKKDIEAISGATVTSTAVTNGVKKALEKVENIGGGK